MIICFTYHYVYYHIKQQDAIFIRPWLQTLAYSVDSVVNKRFSRFHLRIRHLTVIPLRALVWNIFTLIR